MDDLVVPTTAGAVRGVAVGDDLRVWRGIPYATAARWRPPQPPAPWTGVRAAAVFGPTAPQPRSWAAALRPVRTAEDCLTINVVAPRAPGPPRPVLVWIHGGAFGFGSSAEPRYAGHALARRGVVYVSLNYRLGVLGFTDLTRYGAAADLGIRDQVVALEWVRDNVAAFGGDPSAVTVFGESAGGTSVTTLLTAPAARGLFHRAIAQSPAAHLAYRPERTQEWGAQLVGLLGADREHAADALRRASVDELVAAGTALEEWVHQATPGAHPFAPVVDGEVLPAHPAEAALAGATHPVPLIIGTNAHEATIFARTGSTLLPSTRERMERMFALTDPAARDRIVAASGSPVAVAGDHAFWWPSLRVAQGHAAVAPTYVYRFDLAPRLLRLTGIGATHTLELLPVFGELDTPAARGLTALGGRDALRAASARMQEHWLRFARTGDPGWPAYDGRRRTLVIDETDRVEDDPHAARRVAWEGFADYR